MSEERNESGRFIEQVTPGDVLGVLRDFEEPVTAGEVGDKFDITSRAALNKLNSLHENGEIERKKVGGRSVVWWVSPTNDSAFARRVSRKTIADQYGDDYFAQNAGWADDLPDLGENA